MKLEDLTSVEWPGWYVHSIEDKAILRSDWTYDPAAEIYITLEGDNFVTVSYSGIDGDGVFFHAANLTLEELSTKTIDAANDYFEYE
jgi:hypothetical protein